MAWVALAAAGALGAQQVAPASCAPVDRFGQRGFELRFERAQLEGWFGAQRARLDGIVLPGELGAEQVALELVAAPRAAEPCELRVDGALATGIERRCASFVGRVAGDADSSVFLALTATGLRGWIERPAGRVELISWPGAGGWRDWRAGVLDARDAALAAGSGGFACALPPPAAPIAVPSSAQLPGAAFATGPLLAKLALETDFQYFSKFNDLQAASDYAYSLTSAVSSRLWSQAQIVLQLSYLGLYTNANDPWSAPDTGGDLLAEFVAHYQGALPGGANVAHFLSGGLYIGGVAYVDTLCNQSWGFGISTGIEGNTPFPVATGPLTWDFFVMAHELGHNFGSWHTHDYCPALDSCAAGPCVSQLACSDQGTIMSYCHTCGAGMWNITTWYHPTNAQIMRAAAEASCLAPYHCSGCDCPWVQVGYPTPISVAPFAPGGQSVVYTGCHFDQLTGLRVDGQLLAPSHYTVASPTQLTLAMPLVSKVGPVEVEFESAWGDVLTYLFVVPGAQPALGLDYVNPQLQWFLSGLGSAHTVGGAPGDLVFVLGSTSNSPSSLPGIVDCAIGNGFQSLYVLANYAMGPAGWHKQSLPLSASLAGLTLYFQAAALRNATLPLLTSPVASGYVLL